MTYLATNKNPPVETAIDLSLCDPPSYLRYNWEVQSHDTYGSDHYPIKISLANSNPLELQGGKRVKLNKACWETYKKVCIERITEDKFRDLEEPITSFTDIIDDIVNEIIPKTSGKPRPHPTPWFNKECKDAVSERRKSLNILKRNPTLENSNRYHIIRAKARRVIRINKRKSWQNYVSKLNHKTKITKVWDMVRKISGKYKSRAVHHLKNPDGTMSKSTTEISNTLAKHYSKSSSSNNYCAQFQNIKAAKEQQNIDFSSNNHESYNKRFRLKDLKRALRKSKNTAPGPDKIHYEFLRNLPTECLVILLDLINRIWENGNFPEIWRLATVIPIPKPQKDDYSNPKNYRPISLTSCLCKTTERLINERLVWYLETNGYIDKYQSGFRKHRSTNDHLVRLEAFIRHAFRRNHHLVSVMFDLEKAYDTTWRYGILKDLYNLNLRGRLPIFIKHFLTDRKFQVKINNTLSEIVDQEEGVPQGSILSVTMFCIKINNITGQLSDGVDKSLFVDDFQICYSAFRMSSIERKLQTSIDKLSRWCMENGFTISIDKTECIHFCLKRKIHDHPKLKLGTHDIPVVAEKKFLGIIWDSKLTFGSHIKDLVNRCRKALNLLKVVSHQEWGADRSTILHLYQSLVRSKIDYGSFIYGAAAKCHLKKLDAIHNTGLRLALGAFCTTPAQSLYVEANEPPLDIRRHRLALQYLVKLKANTSNPAYECIFRLHTEKAEYDRTRSKKVRPLGIRMWDDIYNSNIPFKSISPITIHPIEPWLLPEPKVIFDLAEFPKDSTPTYVYKEKFQQIKSEYQDHTFIYTDGSKMAHRTSAAAILPYGMCMQERLINNSSIYSGEGVSIIKSLTWMQASWLKKFFICSDSLSLMEGLLDIDSDNEFIKEIQLLLFHLNSQEKTIVFCWVPGHIGIAGNEQADKKAKNALRLTQSNRKIPFQDCSAMIEPLLKSRWQQSWDSQIENKLHAIKPILGVSKYSSRKSRKEETVLARLRLGHTRLTHSYLITGSPPPRCKFCRSELSIKHLMIRCRSINHIRQKYFTQNSMFEIFKNNQPIVILNFIRELQYYHTL
jgi:ribonuclease HI